MIDSNVLVYAFENSDSLKHQLAAELFEKIIAGRLKAAISTQILSEFFVNVTAEKKKNVVAVPLSVEEAACSINELTSISEISVLDVKVATVLAALPLKESSKVSYWDCLIAATMKENGITTIYTEDKDFEKIAGIRVINPFTHPT